MIKLSNKNNLLKINQTNANYNIGNERFERFTATVYSIRAISILLIVIYHIGFWFLTIRFYSNIFVLMIYDFGNIGLDFFFFLSGMLLTINMIKRDVENHSWIDWYKKRIIRILPALWIMLLLISAIQHLVFTDTYNLHSMFINLSGFQDLPIENPNFYTIHFIFWYISAILCCYLLFPLMYIAIRANFKASALIGFILYAILFFYYEFYDFITHFVAKNVLHLKVSYGLQNYYLSRYFVFFFGIVLGYWIGSNDMENLEKIYKLKTGIILFIPVIITFSIFFYYYITEGYHRWMFPFITYCFIPFLIFTFNKYSKINKFLTFFGKRSYEIYLCHSIFFMLLVFIVFGLFSLPDTLLYNLLILPIYLLAIFSFAYFFNFVINIITSKKKLHPHIIRLAFGLFLYAIITIYINIYINYYLTLFLCVPIILFLLLIHNFKISNNKRYKRISKS